MLDLSDPTLNRKKRQKLIKEAYSKINDEMANSKELVSNSSPLISYWNTPTQERTKHQLESLMSSENRYEEEGTAKHLMNAMLNQTEKYEEKYQEIMSELLISDKANDLGIPRTAERKRDALKLVSTWISFLTTDAKIKWLKYCTENKLFSNQTLTKFKLEIYTTSDALHTDKGKVLSAMCIDNDYETLKILIDQELQSSALNPSPEFENNKLTILRSELEELKEKIESGDPFYVYRGFLVEKDEYVRAGKKGSGEDYWQQLGGQGLSYSLSKDIAIYFTYWKLIHNEKGEEVNVARTRKKLLDSNFPNSLITKEECIEEMKDEVYQLRENKINNQRKPILCKYLVDPTDIKGFNMATGEAEVIFKPENVVIENYTILSSQQIAEGLWNWRHKDLETWKQVTSVYNKKGIAVLPLHNQEEVWFYFANAEDVNPVIDKIKNKIKNNMIINGFSDQDNYEITQAFAQNAVEVPIDEFKINPIFFTKELDDLLTNKRTKLKKRVGKAYEWSKDKLGSLLQFAE